MKLFTLRLSMVFVLLFSISCIAKQTTEPTVGAYYFDGWTGKYPYHITPALKDSFANREPKWGWITSTQNIVDQQIDLAADAGLSFFSFCWYYKKGVDTKKESLNNALNYYLASGRKSKLKFCLLIANHGGSEIGPEEWPQVMDELITLFKDKQYQTAEGKPLLIFFSNTGLVKKFGSTEAVKDAFDQLRNKAIQNGLKGVTIAVNSSSQTNAVEQATASGFDILTGYNYHSLGFQNRNGKRAIPIDSLQKGEYREWDNIAAKTNLPYLPVVTLNWDPRPWATPENGYGKAPYYTGFSATSSYNSLNAAIRWIQRNNMECTKEKIILLYAWNENGEGAYLTPSKNGDSFLNGIKKAITNNRKKK